MNVVVEGKSRKLWITWLVAPVMIIAVFATGIIQSYLVNAASPLNGAYGFSGVTTSGPSTGLSITGNLQLQIKGTIISGNICEMSVAPGTCASVDGLAPDEVHVSMTIRPDAGFPDIRLVGVYRNNSFAHGDFTGFAGTYSFVAKSGTSTGIWEARVHLTQITASGLG